jgi:hypothetical protein
MPPVVAALLAVWNISYAKRSRRRAELAQQAARKRGEAPPPAASASDCDFKHVRGLRFEGRRAIARWLRQRFADRDQLTISRIYDKNPEQPLGVVIIEYARRTSDTLRELGYPRGIVPQFASKVAIDGRAGRLKLIAFANGPGGGPDPACSL